MNLNDEMGRNSTKEKEQEGVVLLYENAWTRVAEVTKETIFNLG